jgi:hypothetical protein
VEQRNKGLCSAAKSKKLKRQRPAARYLRLEQTPDALSLSGRAWINELQILGAAIDHFYCTRRGAYQCPPFFTLEHASDTTREMIAPFFCVCWVGPRSLSADKLLVIFHVFALVCAARHCCCGFCPSFSALSNAESIITRVLPGLVNFRRHFHAFKKQQYTRFVYFVLKFHKILHSNFMNINTFQ